MFRYLEPLCRHLPAPMRVLPAFALAYVLCPIDVIPDFIPGIGQLDDLYVLILCVLLILVALACLNVSTGVRSTLTILVASAALFFSARVCPALADARSDRPLSPPLPPPGTVSLPTPGSPATFSSSARSAVDADATSSSSAPVSGKSAQGTSGAKMAPDANANEGSNWPAPLSNPSAMPDWTKPDTNSSSPLNHSNMPSAPHTINSPAEYNPLSGPSMPPSTSDHSDNPMVPPPSDQPNKPVNRFAISLTKAFSEASEHNPDITVGLNSLAIARAQIKSAGAMPNPQFALQYGFGNPYTKIIAGNTQQAGINQLIEMGGKRSARLKAAQENYKLALQQVEALKFDVRSRVRRAYAELAAAEANIELVENQRSLIERLYKIAHRRVQAGAAAEAEEIQAGFAIDQFDALRTSALARLRQASVALDYLLGYKPERDIDVEDNGLFRLSADRTELVPQPDWNLPPLTQLLADAYKQRPDLQAARQQIEVNKSQLVLSKRQAIPDVLLGSGYVFSTYTQDQHVPVQNGAYLNVNVDLPIFYRHQGEIAFAKANLNQARLQADQTTAQVSTDVHIAYAALLSARSNISRYQQKLIPEARTVVKLAQRSYEVGMTNLANAILAQQAFQQTLSAYFDAVVSYQNAWADLEKAIGAPIKF